MQIFYTVQSGDTLSDIANRWGISIHSLIQMNNLPNPDFLFVGQQLSMPPGIFRYRVKPGDTLFNIASQYKVPFSVIIEANNLQAPYTIFPGQLLEVPPGSPYYVVQPGDTLYNIGLRYNVTTAGRVNVQLIQSANGLSSSMIYPGMRLTIPFAPLGEDGIIAYTVGRADGFDIWLYDVANGNTHKLTNGLGESFSVPYWSPNGERISFVGRHNVIFVVTISTGEVARIDQLPEGLGAYLDWSPDSKKLVYAKGNTITLYDVSTHRSQVINQAGATDVQWFPNGNQLLFQAIDENGLSQLYRIRTNGTGKMQITNNTGGRFNHVRLSPNGRYVLYTSPGASISIIYIIDLVDGITREVEGGPLAKNYFPTWNSNSQVIAFSATVLEELGYFSLVSIVNNQGMDQRTLAISNCFSTPVDWSPDGSKLVYLSGCSTDSPASELWVIDVERLTLRQLLTQPNIMSVQWAPMTKPSQSATYRNTNYRIQFQYPAHWEQMTPERYEGVDGFFQISAISSPAAIHVVCQNEAFHQLMPYGSNPTITSTTIQNQEACYIYPSADQAPEMNNQAALIIRYPAPVMIEGSLYQFFILWADQEHIDRIGSSIKFL
ncbi:LysM peptidoglycan-binding domain-containing protein [Ornithinibacillus californiensis]|uniref:LysM peptidoglycan-binding domain-containing protein n=1 Tax=Ornithinibacillus californiensis TaxID=161536 RepID=UPI00064DF0FD|nr:LysM peptidoglycan-binding domain-containing protein [Ornithinibacillus californiensis]